jgi:catechol 2,3-dioxygenase-like lactoylglutathione lyase family enzyme
MADWSLAAQPREQGALRRRPVLRGFAQAWLLLFLPELVTADEPAVVGLDHIPIAVADLEAAVEQYRALGFTLKPGRFHADGIRNQHVKFADGSELELITVPEARDALTQTYREHLASGDGPAFLALFAPVPERAAPERQALEKLPYLFLGSRNHSPSDEPRHFVHPNGAESLISVWLAGEDLSGERRLLEALGARIEIAQVHVPDAVTAPVARLREGDVVLLAASRQLVPGRRIVGATLRVKNIATTQHWFAHGA